MNEYRFTEHFDVLVALVTHLSSTDRKSRVPSVMAKDLAMDQSEVERVLTLFPGFFRQSKNLSSQCEHYYTVHLRYARRRRDEAEESGRSH